MGESLVAIGGKGISGRLGGTELIKNPPSAVTGYAGSKIIGLIISY